MGTLYDLPDELLVAIAECCYALKTHRSRLRDFPTQSPLLCFAARTAAYQLSLATKRLRSISLPIIFGKVLFQDLLKFENRFPALIERLLLNKNVHFVHYLDCSTVDDPSRIVTLLRTFDKVQVIVLGPIALKYPSSGISAALARHGSVRQQIISSLEIPFHLSSSSIMSHKLDNAFFRDLSIGSVSDVDLLAGVPPVVGHIHKLSIGIGEGFVDSSSWMNYDIPSLRQLSLFIDDSIWTKQEDKSDLTSFLERHSRVDLQLPPSLQLETLPLPGLIQAAKHLRNCRFEVTSFTLRRHEKGWYIQKANVSGYCAPPDYVGALRALDAALPKVEVIQFDTEPLPWDFFDMFSGIFQHLSHIIVSAMSIRGLLDRDYNAPKTKSAILRFSRSIAKSIPSLESILFRQVLMVTADPTSTAAGISMRDLLIHFRRTQEGSVKLVPHQRLELEPPEPDWESKKQEVILEFSSEDWEQWPFVRYL